MQASLRNTLILLLLAGAVSAPGARAADYGTLTVDGIQMRVEGAVAVWHEDRGRLSVQLLPFALDEEAVGLIRQGRESHIKHALVAPDSWRHSNPRGSFSVSWNNPETRGDFARSSVHIYAYGIGGENQNLNLSYMMAFVEDDTIEASLTGGTKPGEEIHLVSEGEDVLSDSTISWSLDIRTTIQSPLPKD